MSTLMEHIHRDNTTLPLFDADGLWTPVEFTPDDHEHLVDAYRHADGSITYIVIDMDSEHANPREDDCNLTTLIQRSDRCMNLDDDIAGMGEVYDRFRNSGRNGSVGTTKRMERYLRIFRPDIVHYADYWSAGDSYGWGYITREAWEEIMLPAPPGENATREQVEYYLTYVPTTTPQEAFDAEVRVFAQWANGEVYGAIHVNPDRTDDSCWGFLGYDDHKDICGEFTASPVTETLY